MTVPARPLCVVVVTYRSARDIERCLQSVIADTAALGARVLVADNASDDGTPDLVRRFPGVELIETGANLGFAAANNVALREVGDADVLFLNPDTVVRRGTVPALLAALDADPCAGVAGPRMEDEAGVLQFSARNFPTVPNQLFEAFMLPKLFPRATRRCGEVVCDPSFYDEPRRPGWVSGAAFLVRGDALRQAGDFDDRFFLYAEEKDLQRRLAALGWRVLYRPDAVVVHAHGDTYRPELMAIALRSKLAYFAKHHRGLRRTALEASLALFVAVRIAVASVSCLLGIRVASRRLRGYLGGVRLLLAGPGQERGAPV